MAGEAVDVVPEDVDSIEGVVLAAAVDVEVPVV